MAQSLFGLTPEQIQEARRIQQQQAINQQAQSFGMFGPLYAAGRGMAQQGIESIAGLFPGARQDPMLQKATTTQSIIEKYKGQDFNDPSVLSKMAKDFSEAGIPDIAMQLGERARALTPKVSRTVVAPGASVVDEQGNVLFTAPKDKTEQTKVLPPGAVLVDSQGNIIAQGREPKTEAPKVSAEWTRYQELLGLGVPQAEARSIAYKTNTLDFRKDLEESRKAEQTQRKEQLVETTVRTIDNVMNTIDTASKQIGTFTAGAIGSPLSLIPGTPAKNLAANLETIKANLGFDRLQQMRDASPTGGALGQVAIQELVALQSSLASLDIQQTPAQLRANLNKIKGHYEKWRSAVNKAKEQGVETIGDRVTAPVTPTQQPGGVRRYNPSTGRVE
jgi:hypothetical protein